MRGKLAFRNRKTAYSCVGINMWNRLTWPFVLLFSPATNMAAGATPTLGRDRVMINILPAGKTVAGRTNY